MPGENGKSEAVKGKKPYNPAAMDSELEKAVMGEEEDVEEVKDEEQEEEMQEEAEEGEETEEEEEEAPEDKQKQEAERKLKRRQALEEALSGAEASINASVDESNMSETEKALARKVREMEGKESMRQVNDTLIKLLEDYTPEEQDLLDPEIRKFLRSTTYKLMAKLPASEKAAHALTFARGIISDKIQETTQKKTVAKIEAKRKIEELSGGPKKKANRPEDIKRKEAAQIRKAAMDGDTRAQAKMAGMNDPLLDAVIGDK